MISKKNNMIIDWQLFEGSLHCEEGVCLFGLGKLSYDKWIKWHLPHLKKRAQYVRRIKSRLPVKIARRRARQAAYRYGWLKTSIRQYLCEIVLPNRGENNEKSNLQ